MSAAPLDMTSTPNAAMIVATRVRVDFLLFPM